MTKPVLVLNRDMRPLRLPIMVIKDSQQIINRVIKAVDSPEDDEIGYIVIASYPERILTRNPEKLAKYNLDHWPSIVMTNKYVKRLTGNVLSKHNLYVRDGGVCRYCGCALSENSYTRDHYVPKDLGGLDTWDNVVVACLKCNNTKANLPPTGRWKLEFEPHEPTYGELLRKEASFPLHVWDKQWLDYLPEWHGPVTIKE